MTPILWAMLHVMAAQGMIVLALVAAALVVYIQRGGR